MPNQQLKRRLAIQPGVSMIVCLALSPQAAHMHAESSGRYMSLPSDADSIFDPPACAMGLMSKVPLLTF